MPSFDPNAAASADAGIFGLPIDQPDAAIELIPVPIDITTSYGAGTRLGPLAIQAASLQVDLLDRQFGKIYERGIVLREPDPDLVHLNAPLRAIAERLISRGGAGEGDAQDVSRINAAGERILDSVRAASESVLDAGRVPGVLGGDHSTPLGNIAACAARHPGLAVLQIDAHMDLRPAFEGFTFSHASIMHNVLERVPGVSKLVQIGIRDYCEQEAKLSQRDERVVTHFDYDWQQLIAAGEQFQTLCERAVADLGSEHVYLSVDIDGLDPSLCPNTGTPVPGGFSFGQFCTVLQCVRSAGKRVVGFDLVEVSPGPDGASEWDANVGARVLYKLCGMAGA